MTSHHSVLTHGVAVLVAVALAGVSVPAGAAPDAPEASTNDAQSLRAELVIDTTALGDGGPSMKDVLVQLEDDVLRERGVEPARSDDDPRIVVVVSQLSEDAGVFDNRVEVTIEQAGRTWSDASWGFDCARCSDGHLLSKVGVMLHSAITRLEEGSRDTAAVDTAADQGAETSPEPEQPIDDVSKPKPGPLVWAGGATALVGVAGIAVGVPLALREDRIIGDLDSPKRQGLQTRTPGWTLTGIGAAALVTGGALLTVGLLRWRRAKNQTARTGTATLTPWVSTERVGLGLHGRF